MSDDILNGNAEDDPEKVSTSDKLLSGRSLLQAHINSGKNLPKDGAKDFRPTNSWMEKKHIQSALDERKELLDEERVEKWGCLAGAVWDHKKKLAEVTRRAGKHFQTLGFEKEGALYLYPEEALYLLETNSLELTFGGVPVSIQQAYSLLLGSTTGCNLYEYRTYSHLIRQGYRLLRFTNQKIHTKYERAIRLDQHAPNKRSHPSQSDGNSQNINSLSNSLVGMVQSENCGERAPRQIDYSIKCERQKIPSVSGKSVLPSCSSFSSPGTTLVKNESVEAEQQLNTFAKHLLSEEPACEDNEATVDIERKKCDDEKLRKRTESIVQSGEVVEKQETSHEMSENRVLVADKTSARVQELEAIHEESRSADGINHELNEVADVDAKGDALVTSLEGVKTKAIGIAESLLSLGSALVGKEPKDDHSNCDEKKRSENLNAHLQSEIIKVLGSHLAQAAVSKEALAEVASSAASTILSHISSGDVKRAAAEKDTHNNICDEEISESSRGLLKSCADKDEPLEENSRLLTHNRCEQDGGTTMSLTDSSISSKTSNLVQHLVDFNNSSNDSDDIMDYTFNENDERKKVEGSQDSKRSAPSDAETDCEPVLIKRAKVARVDTEVEILDFVPEKKQVELVNLSDESTMDSTAGTKVSEGDSDGVEVIDVLDSSSSDSSESDSSSSNSDCSVIVEERGIESWDLERRRILETIPNMYNLSEIKLIAPRLDLLPDNVKPRFSQYLINRWRLNKETKERILNMPCTELPDQSQLRPPPLYSFTPQGALPQSAWHPNIPVNTVAAVQAIAQGALPQAAWQPNMPMNPVAAVQAIAQLVLPMLGLSPTAFPSEHLWTPNNPWFAPRPWGPRPRFHQHPRGNNRQRFQSRPYGFRHFAPRYQHHRRGSNYNHQRPRNNIYIQPNIYSTSAINEVSRNEVVPFQGSSRSQPEDFLEVNSSNAPRGPGQWSTWKQKKLSNQRGKKKPLQKRSMRSRYFNAPTNMTALKGESPEVHSETSNESSATCENPIKTESDSSEEGWKSESMDTNNSSNNIILPRDEENTDESCSSPSDVKPLLSPHDCTTFVSVFKSVNVIKEADTQSLVSTASGTVWSLLPQFDLFLPSRPFKKGSPPVPDYHLCIMKCSDNVPTPGEVKTLVDMLNDDVPFMFAIVSPDSISFLQFSDVSLPSILSSN